jgi:Alpha/beta hydrolase domain
VDLKRLVGVVLACVSFSSCLNVGPVVNAQSTETSCDRFLLSPRDVKGGKMVGPTSCLMQQREIMVDGKPFTRIDVGLNGTVEGYATKQGEYKDYLTQSPDLVFPQSGNPGPVLFAIAAYERDKGAAMTIVLPRDRQAWNGKLFITVHGRGASFRQGGLKAWNKNLDPANPTADLNKYDALMVSKGYVLVKTRRTSAEGLGEIKATFEDGTAVDSLAFNDTTHYITDFGDTARAIVSDRLGQAPRRTYFYGHSAGARIGRDLNYTPGLNVDRTGKRYFDAILADDAAAGTWLPVLMKDGKDVLFASDAEKAAFVPQLDISHQMYNNIWDHKMPGYMSSSYLANKRSNARILREKGLAPAKERMYEIRGISHSGGENLPSGRRGEIEILDLSRMMDRFIDILDAWVENGTNPPVSRSDDPATGDVDRDGTIENPALAFPEIACPLGVYFAYPETTSATTSFAAFSGEGVEPLDGKKVFVDMNRNGVWDYRETPSQAWRRLGLLQKNEELTREKYVTCVQNAADRLRRDGFFSDQTAAGYVERAKTADLQPKHPAGR